MISRSMALLFFLSLGLVGCSDDGSSPPPVEVPPGTAVEDVTAENMPSEQIYNYELVESVEGVVQWILDSEKMQKFDGSEEVELFVIELEFFDEGQAGSTLVAKRGRVNERTKELFVWDDVVLTTARGWRLETSELYYDTGTERIYNDVFDRFTRGGDWVTGYGLEATPDLEYIEIKRQTEGEVGDEVSADDGTEAAPEGVQ